jgi:hypothetical protein
LVLLDEFVKVGRQQFEDETQVTTVDKRVLEPEDVMLVPRVPCVVELLTPNIFGQKE